MGKIDLKKKFKKNFFQCLAMLKELQSFCSYVVRAKKMTFFIYQYHVKTLQKCPKIVMGSECSRLHK
jgi:hypothetical protein